MLKGKSPSLFDMMARDKGPPVIEVSKYCLDFDKKVAPIGGELTDRVSLTVKCTPHARLAVCVSM